MSHHRSPLLRLASAAAAAGAVVLLAGCSASADGETADAASEPLRIVAAATPHQEILEYIRDELVTPEDGLELDIVTETEGVQSNQLIVDDEVDGSFTQHLPYLTQWLVDAGQPEDAIVPTATVHVEPLGLYYNASGDVTTLDDVTEGTSIAITNDVVNQNRALLLLAANDLITLPDGFDVATDTLTVKDVLGDDAINTTGLELSEVDYSLTARAVADGETDLAVVNGNVALQTGLSIDDDTLALESATDNPYANLLTVRKEFADDPRVATLSEYLESPEVASWITETYGSAVLPVNPTS
ncbi:MetQ/NlpA family ABC transporter substrate-binding protein [Mycetocola reblochoni]|uniref:Methionine ABC transporter substrate-binding protein n=2 Tax=Mycetocola reblochoni TaxID=331618 RepID=A0A1R4KCV8_9MICO|nr:MetQ/NlpA family ABC transporter substrate-binding protein [Mycetocola reblochoni]RLP71240.1 metal ABC transporter substrate-binding protein [Mycetocola reblochoni]SJN42241.1 Methionine ABC transporter substrate-binding protein [Mycetocola reblochoni REB411]